ncbi:MAG: class I SAM-dependent methyltransferase [Rhodospirillaceae bacterium]
MSNTLQALLLPFRQGLVPPPQPGRGFFLRAEAGAVLDEAWRRALVCEQSFKPTYENLLSFGFHVKHELPGGSFDVGSFDVGLCLMTKHKAENLANLGRGWLALRPGGILVCAGANNIGADSVERALASVVGAVGSKSKYHCRVFWAERTADIPPTLAGWVETGRLQLVPETGCQSRPGLYNWNKVDDGSALLLEHLPNDLSGRVADLGAGWGYLSLRLLERTNRIAKLDLFEAEWLALEAARANLDRFRDSVEIGFHWHDVAAGIPSRAFDAIIMNPPFHSGKAADLNLGRSFINAAAQGLVPGGRLILVANRNLPYESLIEANFRSFRTLVETGSYKVILAKA